ncbi:MAG: ABC transporter ATP-binding protein [Spirochaetaceae bacterium]|nr:MAG: ABC transporter ATP-binding protein [Spirochaetaceae bacterium]
MEPIINVHSLSKSFGEVQAVRGVTFSVSRGELFGFLGPNGAGKTTTINMLTGLARPDRGSISIAGIDCPRNPKAAQHLMGIVPDESNLYPELTGFQNLSFCGALYGMKKTERVERARELLERFGLTEAADRKFAGYSKGMKRKLTIAAGIIHSPEILFLDEPTSGIDVASARQLRRLIAELNQAGTTIFLTTHYIEEAERLCSRIAFIVSGGIRTIDTVEHLMSGYEDRQIMHFEVSSVDDTLCAELGTEFPRFDCRTDSRNRICIESSETIAVGQIVRFFEDRGIDIYEARKIRPSLEDVFVQVTGIEAGAMHEVQEKSRQR